VPYLSGFEGISLFLDSDMLVRGDVCELETLARIPESNVAMVIGPRRFEWPSVMLFQNGNCGHMTPEYVEKAKLYDFAWAVNPEPLPHSWNHLVGYDPPNPDAKIVHCTMGIPIWEETKNCEFADEWRATFQRMNSSVSFQDLMGRSVHIPHLEKLAR
jgi:hypothetical protein